MLEVRGSANQRAQVWFLPELRHSHGAQIAVHREGTAVHEVSITVVGVIVDATVSWILRDD